MYYPLFIDLRSAQCLVVGAGQVGLRKTRTLLECEAGCVHVLDPHALGADWQQLLSHPALRVEQRTFTPTDVDGCMLVFACTNDHEHNALIAQCCARQGILCNCTDAPDLGSFIVPAVARTQALTAAVSTSGGSPAWARVLRQQLEQWLEPRDAMSILLTRLRPHVLALHKNTGQNTELFRAITLSALPQALADKDARRCTELLQQLLPVALHPRIPELLYELV